MKRTTRRTVLLLAVLLLLGLSLFFRTSALSPGDAASTGFYARQGLIPARPQPSAAPAAEPTGEPARQRPRRLPRRSGTSLSP